MLMPPTTTLTIHRGTVVDAYGDPTDEINPIATDVPAIIAYSASTRQDPASGRPVQVSAYDCVVERGTDIRPQDRVVDNQTGVTYEVTNVSVLPSYGLPTDVQVALWRVDDGA